MCCEINYSVLKITDQQPTKTQDIPRDPPPQYISQDISTQGSSPVYQQPGVLFLLLLSFAMIYQVIFRDL